MLAEARNVRDNETVAADDGQRHPPGLASGQLKVAGQLGSGDARIASQARRCRRSRPG